MVQAGPHNQFYIIFLRHLHRAVVEYPCPKACQLQHLIIGDGVNLLCILNHPWVCGVHTVHVRINLTFIRMKHSRKGNGRGVRAAPSQCGHIIILVHSLEAGHNHNLSGIQLMKDSLLLHTLKTGVAVPRGGMHPHLKPIEGHSRNIQGLQGHGHQGY